MPSCTTPTFSKIAVTSQLTQPAALAVCQASGSAVATMPALTLPCAHRYTPIADEDAYVRESVDVHQKAMKAHMRVITRFQIGLTALNAALLVGTAAIGVYLWAQGSVSAGIVATALPLAWQTANAAGWVSWEVTAIFENVGVVQEGMQSIAVPHSGTRPASARPLQ